MAGQCITPDQALDIAVRDANRLVGKIGRSLARRVPYLDVLGGGTIGSESDVVRSAVEERAVLANSLAAPSYVNDISMCGFNPTPDQVGKTVYQYQLQTLRGKGPRICVKVARTAYRDNYIRATEALEQGIIRQKNADIRYQIMFQSGIKFVSSSTHGFSQNLTGDEAQINTQFAQWLPDSGPSFAAIRRILVTQMEEFGLEKFSSEQGEMAKLIASDEALEVLRNQLDVKADLLALVQGKYNLGEKSIAGYSFQGPYRGVAFGIDPQPLRASGFDGNGNLVLVEPEIATVVSTGVGARRNPAWVSAPYELMFLFVKDSFEYLTPEAYSGEGTWKFSPQLYAGELMWKNITDNDCNAWGDFGQHLYQIQRAIRPVRPHAVCPILIKRCPNNLNITPCAIWTGSGSTGL